MVYIVYEIHEVPGQIGSRISVSMNIRNGLSRYRAKKANQIRREIYVSTILSKENLITSLYPEEIMQAYLKNIARQMIAHLRKDTARMVDLRESWFERLKFLFNPNEKEI